ncbi:MAG: hypothetical protein ACRDVP_07400 [Acidimicrobiales bacterium]
MRLTERDVEILRWIGRHGVVTTQQVARHFFQHDGAVAVRRCECRIFDQPAYLRLSADPGER